jgi:hypothetical protein
MREGIQRLVSSRNIEERKGEEKMGGGEERKRGSTAKTEST